MEDLELIREQLENNGYTCLIVKGSEVYSSFKNGIAPLIDWLGEGKNFDHAVMADKIVGKAVALLCVYANIDKVYGSVMSKAAVRVLDEYKIKYAYTTLTDRIINRTGDDICPMEKTVLKINDPTDAYKALKEKVRELRGF